MNPGIAGLIRFATPHKLTKGSTPRAIQSKQTCVEQRRGTTAVPRYVAYSAGTKHDRQRFDEITPTRCDVMCELSKRLRARAAQAERISQTIGNLAATRTLKA